MSSSSISLTPYLNNPRITDFSFVAGARIMNRQNAFPTSTLLTLYQQQLTLSKGSKALYPQSNWQPHRLVVLSAIAVRLRDRPKIDECERLAREWIGLSNCRCCRARSQDFHHRDSVSYVVYGWWALAQTFVYLQTVTNNKYRPLFTNYLQWMADFSSGKLVHIEFLNSKIPSDTQNKSQYNKPFDPNYHQNFVRVYQVLKS